MKNIVLVLSPPLLALGFTVCHGATETEAPPSPFEEAMDAATDTDRGPVLHRVWAGIEGRHDFSCGGPSPDGKLFTLVDWETGDLVAYDTATGEIRNLTDKGTWNENGSWNECSLVSPDGEQVAFNYAEAVEGEFQYQLRVLDLEDPTNSQRVLLEVPPNWGWIAPADWQGDEILAVVCVPEEPNRLVAVDVADGSSRAVVAARDEVLLPANFSPDGTTIAYQRGEEIRLVGIDGENDRASGIEEGRLVGWSRDGRLLYHLPNARELRAQPLTEGRADGDAETVRADLTAAFPVRMADDSLFYGVAVETPRIQTATIDWKGGKLSNAVPVSPTIEGNSGHPTWSPDGRTLAYLHRPLGARTDRIILRSTMGNEMRVLTEVDLSNAANLDWSPDGRSIWFEANGESAPALYRAEVRTGEISKIMEGMGRGFTLGPDGTAYVHRSSLSTSEPGIYAVKPTGEEPRRLSADDSARQIRNFGVSADGTMLAYSTADGTPRTHRLIVIPTNGGEARKVLELPAGQYITSPASTLVWSPDGRQLLFRRASDEADIPSTLEMVSIEGGEPRVVVAGNPPIHLELHPDGQRLALTSGDYEGELWKMTPR